MSDLTGHVAPRGRITTLADEPDNRILECALASHADFIVTGDRQMLRPGHFEGVDVVSLKTFPDRLEA